MKRSILYLIALVSMIIVGACTPKAEIELSFDTDCIEIGPEGGVRTIAVTVGEDWVARTNEPWIAFSPANGKASEKCQIIIDSTLVFDQREDVVRIQTASGYKDITIVQKGFEPKITPKTSLVEIEDFAIPSKRKFEVVVETNVELTKPADTEWLTCKMSDQTLDRGARPRNVTLTFEWRVNPYADIREEIVNLVGTKKVEVSEGAYETLSAEANFTVSQGGAPDIESVKNTPAGDSLALLSISRFLGCWTEYDTGVSMNRWEGVKVYEKGPNKGRVKSAQFIFFETDEALPYAVKYLTEAEELYFFSNVNSFLKNLSLGEDICELKKLKKLTMFAYGLTEIPDAISNMESLRYLDLDGNNFKSIPKALKNCKNLKALFMSSNQRSVVSDLSNTVRTEDELGGFICDYDEVPSDGSTVSSNERCTKAFPKWLLEWDQLDTLRLSVNYLQGTLPSDEDLINAGFPVWDVDDESTFTEEVSLRDSLGADGLKFFRENRIPKVLPDIDFLAINLNRLHGNIPNWLKYHPKLDYWYPLLLVFPQEGRDAKGHQAGFIDVPTNLNYYYKYYNKKKWSSINTI